MEKSKYILLSRGLHHESDFHAKRKNEANFPIAFTDFNHSAWHVFHGIF